MTAYAYLRRSVIHQGVHTDSPQTQEDAVRDLAARHGHDELVILSDWDKSGKLSREKRPGYDGLLSAVESGAATAVYSYSLSRLGRSVKELSNLFDLCASQGVPLRIVADVIDTSTASGRMTANILASVAQFESEVASERQKARIAYKRSKGISLATVKPYGGHDGEDTDVVLAAFREAGSYSGAARILNQRKVKPRNGRAWWPSAVRVVVRRADPSVEAMLPSRDYRRGSDFVLAKLLTCPTCGTRLSGTRDRLDGPNHGRVRYACRLGTVTPHPRITISEHLVMPAIRREADRLRTPDQLEMTPDVAERQRLEDRRARILDLYESADITKQEKNERLEAVHAAMRKLDAHRMMVAVPAVNWDAEPRMLNAVLRALFARIDLDPESFQPVAFTWRVPEWRS